MHQSNDTHTHTHTHTHKYTHFFLQKSTVQKLAAFFLKIDGQQFLKTFLIFKVRQKSKGFLHVWFKCMKKSTTSYIETFIQRSPKNSLCLKVISFKYFLKIQSNSVIANTVITNLRLLRTKFMDILVLNSYFTT